MYFYSAQFFFLLVNWTLCCCVKFALSASLVNTKDYSIIHWLLLPHPFSFSPWPCPPHLWPCVPTPKRFFRNAFFLWVWNPKAPPAPHEGLIVSRGGLALGWQGQVSTLGCLGSGGYGGSSEEKEQGKRASSVIRLSICVVPRPSLHVQSPFKNQNKYWVGDKPLGPPPWLLPTSPPGGGPLIPWLE